VTCAGRHLTYARAHTVTLEAALARAVPSVALSASGPDRIAYARDLWTRHHLAVSEGRIAEHRAALVALHQAVAAIR